MWDVYSDYYSDSDSENEHMPQQEEAVHGSVLGDDSLVDYPNQSTGISSELVVSLSSSTMSKSDRNLVGMPTQSFVKTIECHNHASDDDDSEERKKKAMDRLRKVSTFDFLLSLCYLPFV